MDVTQQVQEMIFASERSKNACRTYSYTEVKYDIWLGLVKMVCCVGKIVVMVDFAILGCL